MVDILEALKKNPFVLAPMAGITDPPFRSFMRELSCSMVVTELISANGLKFNSEKTRRMMAFEEIQRPVGIQLFGETPDIVADAARQAEQMGADFVDLNFGCPVKKVVCKGAGSAMLKDLPRMAEMLRQVKSAIRIPLTIKVRTGWDDGSRNALEVARLAHDEGITWVAIHGRTRAAGYSGLADWDYIAQVKAQSPLPILGNGDVTSAQLAVERLRQSGCDGILIGRGCLKNPLIFKQALNLWNQNSDSEIVDFVPLLEKLYQHLCKFYDDHVIKIQMRKFAGWYSAGYPNSSTFRKSLYANDELAQIKAIIFEYFGEARNFLQKDTSDEAFLMGGHG